MSENFDAMRIICKTDVQRLEEKSKSYGPSWRQRGGAGAFMMLARKWDRIENWCKANDWDIFKLPSDMMDNDVGDLRRYLLLVEAHLTPVTKLETVMVAEYNRDADAPDYEKDLVKMVNDNNPLLSYTMRGEQVAKLRDCHAMLKLFIQEFEKCSDYTPSNKMLLELTNMELQIGLDLDKMSESSAENN